jgi:hypothetical protein
MAQNLIADFYKNKSQNNEDKVFSLALITILVYATVGFCLASIDVNLIWWLLTILLYHWYLSKQSLDFSTLIVIASLKLAIIYIMYQARPSLSLESSIAIAFFATINPPILTKLTTVAWGIESAIAVSTVIAWLGLIIGWLLFQSSLIV